MKPILLLPLVLVTSAGSALLGARFAAQDAGPAQVEAAAGPAPVAERPGGAELEARFQRLEQRVADLAVALERRPAQVAATAAADTSPAAAREASVDAPEADARDPRAAYEALLSGELDWEARERLWDELRASGEIDAVLALFEAAAALDPNDPDLQVDLGRAYIAKLQEGGSNLEVGMLATKADTAFDAALALDEDHLEARRQKAVSLSFWPPVLGKQVEAAQQFELLIEKQQQHPADDSHALAYLWLGNLKLQMGDKQAAQGAWQNGLALFPEHAELLAQLAGTQE